MERGGSEARGEALQILAGTAVHSEVWPASQKHINSKQTNKMHENKQQEQQAVNHNSANT